jgi:hypothetical protein
MVQEISDVDVLSGRGMTWSAEVEVHSRLRETRLVSCECKSSIEPGQPLPTETQLLIQSAGKLVTLIRIDAPGLLVDTFLSFKGAYAPPTGLKGEAFIKLQFRALYELDGTHHFRREQLTAFSTWGAQIDCWGFLREIVASLTVRMGLPPYQMPSHAEFIANHLADAGVPISSPGTQRKTRRTKSSR